LRFAHKATHPLGDRCLGDAPHLQLDDPLRVLQQLRGLRPHLEPAHVQLQHAIPVPPSADGDIPPTVHHEGLHCQTCLGRGESVLTNHVCGRGLHLTFYYDESCYAKSCPGRRPTGLLGAVSYLTLGLVLDVRRLLLSRFGHPLEAAVLLVPRSDHNSNLCLPFLHLGAILGITRLLLGGSEVHPDHSLSWLISAVAEISR